VCVCVCCVLYSVVYNKGLTIKGLLSVELGDSEKEHGLTFVALSRATSIDNVFLCSGCSLERLTTKISEGYKLKQRIKEDDRLQKLFEETMEFYNMQ
jgi:Fe-S cluster biogenesis protein NfuA